jgi:hypothetical protein
MEAGEKVVKKSVTVQVVQIMLQQEGLLGLWWNEAGVTVQAHQRMQPDTHRSYTPGHVDAAA